MGAMGTVFFTFVVSRYARQIHFSYIWAPIPARRRPADLWNDCGRFFRR
jgi:hypothetical protein